MHRVDRKGTDLDATQGALNLHLGNGTIGKTFGIVRLFVVSKRHILGLLILAERLLLGIKRLDAKVSEGINLSVVAFHLDGDVADAIRDG